LGDEALEEAEKDEYEKGVIAGGLCRGEGKCCRFNTRIHQSHVPNHSNESEWISNVAAYNHAKP
jgi:hypothetical protein